MNRLPVEFSLYARGAAAYHSRNLDSALDLFTQVLALPPQSAPSVPYGRRTCAA